MHFLGKLHDDGRVRLGVSRSPSTAAVLWWLYRSLATDFTLGRHARPADLGRHGHLPRVPVRGDALSRQSDRHARPTLFYVFVGCALQFVIGLGLAFLCSQPISGKNFFRVIFFIPLMITPLGVGYAMRMVADTTKGPFEPFWQWVGPARTGPGPPTPGRRASS